MRGREGRRGRHRHPGRPDHALDDIPRYRAGLPSVRRGWAQEVADIAGRNPLTEDLTAEDALAVADYTGDWALDMNNYLRGRPVPGNRANQVNDRIDGMDRALSHLPPAQGTFLRGTFMPAETIERLRRGDQVGMPEYLSTSTDRGRESEVVIPRGGTFEQTRTGTTRIDGKEYKVIYLKQTAG